MNHTGLNSYYLRAASGELVYDVAKKLTGYSTEMACSWLWTPEEVEIQVAKLAERMPWAGQLTAQRARP